MTHGFLGPGVQTTGKDLSYGAQLIGKDMTDCGHEGSVSLKEEMMLELGRCHPAVEEGPDSAVIVIQCLIVVLFF